METKALSLLINKIIQAKKSEFGIEPATNFASLIKAINLSYSGNWESEHMPFVRDFYERTRAGLPVPVLSVCGKGTQEIRFSSYLAYFLNRKGLHGLGNLILIGLLEICGHMGEFDLIITELRLRSLLVLLKAGVGLGL